MATNNRDVNDSFTGLVEFLKTCRTLSNQLQIMEKVKMSGSDSELTQNAAKNLLENINSYINQVEKK